MNGYLLVNFGGPRDLAEIFPFLKELLCDRDVIRTRFPALIHRWLFSRVAKKRSLKIQEDYREIGGKSPIYFDTETLAQLLSERLQAPVYTFHRYLPATHSRAIQAIREAGPLQVLPLFPQFCYATTGSIARFLSAHSLDQLLWIQSYASHPAFIAAYQKRIADFLEAQAIREEEVTLLFSAHGIPQSFVEEGDIYETECQSSFSAVMQAFPRAIGHLSYQSKFGRGEWLRPYTDEACRHPFPWCGNRKQIVIVPISFTSDHIETLFEIEKLYLPLLSAQGLKAYRCPALNTESYWVDALIAILRSSPLCQTQHLVRKSRSKADKIVSYRSNRS